MCHPSLLVCLVGGREIRLGVEPEEWASVFDEALAKNEAIQIEDPADGGKFGINPQAVLYWKAVPGSR